MDPTESLNDKNGEQIRKYIKFFRQKKDAMIRTINREFSDIRNDKLESENMFTKEEMEEYSDYLQTAIRSTVSSDISMIINMSSLVITQLLESAQEKNLDINIETATIENQVLLEAIEKMNLEAIPKKTRGVGELVSLKDEAKAQREEMDKLESKNVQLQEDIKRLKENQKLNNYDIEEKMERLTASLDEAKEENNKRVSETTQFQQMKKLMQSQSVKIRQLRERLSRYEPDDDYDTKEDDN